jgi:hypothetical protein
MPSSGHAEFVNNGSATMFSHRFSALIFLVGFQAAVLSSSSGECAVVAPVALPPGGTVSSLPNGYSSYPGDEGTLLFNRFIDFDFDDGLLSGVLRERVIRYQQVNQYHPYGGLYFDYEISLSSGDVAEFSVPGYAGVEVAVKQCGILGCGGSGSGGVSTTSASRSSDGNWVSFFFDGDLSGTAHSANLQLLTNACCFSDPYATLTNAAGDTFSVPVLTPVAVPEPPTWAMLLLGFTALGFAGYWRARAGHATLAAQLVNHRVG